MQTSSIEQFMIERYRFEDSFELSSICNDYIDLDQFAYREGHNSTMALIKCQHTWLKWLDGNADFVRIFPLTLVRPSTLYQTISSVVN